jgi:type IV pilus assembly protein PilE
MRYEVRTVKIRQSTGFTLIELLITMVIVGILSAIALPSYTDYVRRSKIPDATSTLAAKRAQMEQYFQDNHTYAGAPACVADAATSKYFTFDCAGTYGVAPTASLYTIEAVGTGSMAGFVYTLDQSNNKTTVMTAGAPSGWTGNASCWVTRKGGVC